MRNYLRKNKLETCEFEGLLLTDSDSQKQSKRHLNDLAKKIMIQ